MTVYELRVVTVALLDLFCYEIKSKLLGVNLVNQVFAPIFYHLVFTAAIHYCVNGQMFVNGHMVSTNVSLNDGNWNHLCASWTSVGGEWKIFVNGTQRAAGHNLATGTYILTGGLLVLGNLTSFTGWPS